jgi:hypothetical protein
MSIVTFFFLFFVFLFSFFFLFFLFSLYLIPVSPTHGTCVADGIFYSSLRMLLRPLTFSVAHVCVPKPGVVEGSKLGAPASSSSVARRRPRPRHGILLHGYRNRLHSIPARRLLVPAGPSVASTPACASVRGQSSTVVAWVCAETQRAARAWR